MFRVKLALLLIGLMVGGLFSACSMIGLSTKKAAPDELFGVVKNVPGTDRLTGVGFMDKTGKIVAGPFELFEWDGKKYGLDGESVFHLQSFSEGLAGLCLQNILKDSGYPDSETTKCGFIDKTGKIVIEPKYKKIGDFHEGLASVTDQTDKDVKNIPGQNSPMFGYIDTTGKLVIEQKFSIARDFSDGIAVATAHDTEKTHDGYIDKTGKFIFDDIMYDKHGFGDEFGIVGPSIIDKTGKTVATVSYSYIGNRYAAVGTEGSILLPAFSEGLSMAYSKTDAYGFINTKGELEIKLDGERIAQIRPFSEGFAPIRWKDGLAPQHYYTPTRGPEKLTSLWTFIDRKGAFIGTDRNTYKDANSFSEGLAAVKSSFPKNDGLWGYINTKLETAVPFCFLQPADFHGGLAYVRISQYADNAPLECQQYYEDKNAVNWMNFYIDQTGKIIKPQW